MPDIPQWWMKGDWFDVCSCNIPCPCVFAQPPTDNHCEGVLAYRIREGAYGDVRLDGLCILILVMFDGNLWEGATPTGAFFFDERADAAQREALQAVFRGAAGGFIGNFAKLIKVNSIEFVPISFHVDSDLATWRTEIPGKFTGSAEALSGPTTPPGKRVQMLNTPGSETGPGQVLTWGRALEDEADVPGFRWKRHGKSAKHIPFDWSGPC